MTSSGSAELTVLFVIDGLGTGGAQRSLAESLPFLVQAGVRPIIACLDRKDEGVEATVLGAGHDVRFLAGRSQLAKIADLRRLVARERPDVVHTALFNSDLAGRLAAVGSRAKVLTSLVNCDHGDERLSDSHVPRTKLRAVFLIERVTARYLTDHFHAVSESVKEQTTSVLGIPPGRITVVERSRDRARLGDRTAERRNAVRSRLGLGEDDRVVVNVGRQEFSKGQRYLIEAFDRLAPSDDRLVLLIAGRRGHSSPELDELQRRSQWRDRIRLLGHRDDVPDILAASDVFAFPSLYEGYPGAMLEAMALGLPSVASDIPSVREPFGGTGSALLVPPRDPGALAAALGALLADPARAGEMGERARRVFDARPGVDGVTAQMVEMYRAVVAGHGSPAAPAVASRPRS